LTEEVYTLLFDIKSKGANTLQQQTNAASKGMTTLGNATTNVNTQAGKAQKTLTKTGKGVQDVGKNSGSAASSVRNFGGGMMTAATGISTLAIGVTGLMRDYRDLNDAQLGVDRAQKKLDSANLQLKHSHEAVNKALKEHGKNSKEYKDALAKEKIAIQGVDIATFNLGEKQETLGDIQQNFYLNLLPTGIGLLTTIGGLTAGFGRSSEGAAKGIGSMSKSSKILSGILKVSPLFLLAGAFLAIRTNAFGFRDMLDKLGKKLGDMFPGLRGFLQWVRDLGAAFGLTGGKLDLSKAFELLKSGFESFKKTLETTDWGAVMDDIAKKIQDGINNFDWAGAWQAFKDAIWATGTWLQPRLAQIGGAIQAYFSDPKNQAAIWNGFQFGMYAAGTWIYEQLGKIFDVIYKYFSDPKVQQAIWEGFQFGLYATGSWIFEQLGKIFDAIYKYFSDPKIQAAIWNGFYNGLYGAGKWIFEQLGKIFDAVYKYFSNPKIQAAIWDGFYKGLYGTGVWIGKMLAQVLNYVGSWWKSNNKALTSAFFGFFDFLYKSAVTAGKTIAQKIKDGLVAAAKTLLSAGKFIWDKISAGLGFAGKTLSQIGQAIANKLQGKSTGGIIQSAATGRVVTTRGPQLVLAGDNPGGKEDVAFIPRNNPGRTLAEIDKIYGRRASLLATGGGRTNIALHVYVQLGGRTIEEIVKIMEIELGKNFRTVIP